MKFNVGDSVKLIVDKSYSNGDDIPAGTKGVVMNVYPLLVGYKVKFMGFAQEKKVLEKDLSN